MICYVKTIAKKLGESCFNKGIFFFEKKRMSLESSDSDRFVRSVISRLENNDFAGAAEVLKDDRHGRFLKNNSWELMPLLCKKLNDRDSYAGSKELLELLAENVDPDEAVLEFLEQLDEANETQFPVLLTLLKTLLFRSVSSRKNSLEWCLNSVRSYLERVSTMEEDSTSEKLDQNNRIKTGLENALLLLEAFVAYVSDNSHDPEAKALKLLLASRLIQFCDVMLPFIIGEKCDRSDEIQCRVVNSILKLMPDPLVLLQHIFYRCSKVKNDVKEEDRGKKVDDLRRLADDDFGESEAPISVFEDESVIPDLSYGIFFYIFLTRTDFGDVPLVYSTKYIFLTLSHVAVCFFEKPEDGTVRKGLIFLQLLLDRLHEQLEKCDLYFETHQKLLVNLNNVMIYSATKENRMAALKCFRSYMFSFDWEARYWLLFHLRRHVGHSGTLGYLVTVLKEFVSQFLNLPASSKTFKKFSKYYRGKLLFDIIKRYCFFTETTCSDLVENADHVISSLNFIRFLILKDKYNVMDVKFFVKKIQGDYLKPLKECISASKNHYDVRLKDLEIKERELSSVVEVSVKNYSLPKLTKEEQKTACLSSLNAIDLIDCLFNRVSELIYESYSYRL